MLTLRGTAQTLPFALRKVQGVQAKACCHQKREKQSDRREQLCGICIVR